MRLVPAQAQALTQARGHRLGWREGRVEGGTVGDALAVAEELRGASPRRLAQRRVRRGERRCLALLEDAPVEHRRLERVDPAARQLVRARVQREVRLGLVRVPG